MRLTPLFLVVLLVGCDRSDSSKPVEIGHIHASDESDYESKTLKAAVEDFNINTSQPLQSRQLQIRHASGGNTPEEWGAQATRLLLLNRVTGLIGGNRWQEAEKIGAAVQSEKALAITNAGWAGPTPSANLFCIGVAPSERGRVLALVGRDAKPKQIVIIRDPAAKAACLSADEFIKMIRDPSVSISEVDISSTKKFETDVIFFACSASQALKARDLAINQPLLLFGDEDAQLPTLFAAGKSADRFHVATACYPEAKSERLSTFVARYQQTYKQAPTINALLAHDAFTLWVVAARVGGCDSGAMRAVLLKPEEPFNTLTGQLTFADDHTARRPIFVGKLANGSLIDVKTYEPAPLK